MYKQQNVAQQIVSKQDGKPNGMRYSVCGEQNTEIVADDHRTLCLTTILTQQSHKSHLLEIRSISGKNDYKEKLKKGIYRLSHLSCAPQITLMCLLKIFIVEVGVLLFLSCNFIHVQDTNDITILSNSSTNDALKTVM